MSLGRRTARQHETAASVRATAGVRSEDYWDFKPGQAVMTVDGYPGTVTAVQDGPYPGSEAYLVTLAHGLGGGEYRAGELSPIATTTASTEHTAADDYPELGTVLVDRPDIAHNTVLASKTATDNQTCVHAHCSNTAVPGRTLCDHHLKVERTEQAWHTGAATAGRMGDILNHPAREGFDPTVSPSHAWEYLSGVQHGYHHGIPDDLHDRLKDVSHHGEVNGRAWGIVDGHNYRNGAGGVSHSVEDAIKAAGPHKDYSQMFAESASKTAGVYDETFYGGDEGPDHHDIDSRLDEKTCPRCGGDGCRDCRGRGRVGTVPGIDYPTAAKTAEVTHDYVVDEDRLLPKACSHCGADGMSVFASSVEDTGRGFRATCSNCKGQMVTSGHGLWNPALPSAMNQPSSAPNAPLPGFRWGASLQTEAVGPTCPNCRGDMEPEYAKQDSYRCPDCGVSGKPQERAEALPEHLRAASMLYLAAKDGDFHFHFTASWADVRSKAKRIRTEGGVHVVSVTGGEIVGQVQGDHHIYETQITTVPGRRAVAVWACACKWGAYAWGRSPAYKRFEGRMCSHALALHFEAQSRGMFGREVREDTQRPSWMRQRTPVVVHHDRDSDTNQTRRAVPPGNMRRTFSSLDVEGVYEDDSVDLAHPPVLGMVEEMVVQGADPADLITATSSLGYSHEDAKALLVMATSEARKPKHKQRRQRHNVCMGQGCRGCGGRGWIGYGLGGWWGPWGGGVGAPQTADGVSTGGDVGGDGGAGGGVEASLQTTAAELHELDALHSQHEVYQGPRPGPEDEHHATYVHAHAFGFVDGTNRDMTQEEVHARATGNGVAEPRSGRNQAWAQGYLDGHATAGGAGGPSQHLGSSNDPLEEFTDPRDFQHRILHNQENPGSSGFATAPDAWPHFKMDTRVEPEGTYASLRTEASDDEDLETCSWCSDEVPDSSLRTTEDGARVCAHCWSHTEPAPGQRRRAALDEALFEPDPTPQQQFAQGVAREYNRLEAAEAILEDEPAPALPQTEGDPNDPLSAGRMAVPPGPNSDGDLTDDEALAQYTGSVEETVAAFQATAKHLQGGGGGQDSSDIAEAARQALAKMALKEFTPAEQQALISEGADVRAGNLDRLDIAGTHYEAVLAAQAAEAAADDEWLA